MAKRIRVSAFPWVPEFARGQVRDLRVRWALEEAGLPYETYLIDHREKDSDAYLRHQPFGQVPMMLLDDDHSMFESGAIVLKIGENHEALLPRDERRRDKTLSWLFASLNSVEPSIMQLAELDFFVEDETVRSRHRPSVVKATERRLDHLESALGDDDYLVENFTIADLMMTTVLRILNHTEILAGHPTLSAYVERCTARPAFQRALKAQLQTFDAHAPGD